MSTLLPGDLATRGKLYDSLASMWTAFVNIKHNTSPAIDSDAFASIPQTPSYRAPFHGVTSAIAVSALQRHRPGRPASYDVSTVSFSHFHFGQTAASGLAMTKTRNRMHCDKSYCQHQLVSVDTAVYRASTPPSLYTIW